MPPPPPPTTFLGDEYTDSRSLSPVSATVKKVLSGYFTSDQHHCFYRRIDELVDLNHHATVLVRVPISPDIRIGIGSRNPVLSGGHLPHHSIIWHIVKESNSAHRALEAQLIPDHNARIFPPIKQRWLGID